MQSEPMGTISSDVHLSGSHHSARFGSHTSQSFRSCGRLTLRLTTNHKLFSNLILIEKLTEYCREFVLSR